MKILVKCHLILHFIRVSLFVKYLFISIQNEKGETGLSPLVKYLVTIPRRWIISVISVLFLLCFCAGLFIDALWSPAGKGLTDWL